jgi:hypothetical protein
MKMRWGEHGQWAHDLKLSFIRHALGLEPVIIPNYGIITEYFLNATNIYSKGRAMHLGVV